MAKDGRKIAYSLGVVTIVGGVIYLGTKARAGPPTPPMVFKCPYCGEVFGSQEELLRHQEEKHPEKPPVALFICPYCGAEFFSEEELDGHIGHTHPEEVLPPPPPPPSADWTAFGACLQQSWGGSNGYIANGVGLALCMEAKGATWVRYKSGGAQLRDCGFEHPEYLTSFANSVPPPDVLYEQVTELGKYGIAPGAYGENLYIGQIIEDSPLVTMTIIGLIGDGQIYYCSPDRGCSTWFSGTWEPTYIGPIIETVKVRRTWKVPWWWRFPHQSACDFCGGNLL